MIVPWSARVAICKYGDIHEWEELYYRNTAMVRIFNSSQLKEAGEYIASTQGHYIVRSADFKHQWTKFFEPRKAASWNAQAYEQELNQFMDVNCSRYGYDRDSLKVVANHLRWSIVNDVTGETAEYENLNEMLFLEGVDTWRALCELGTVSYEIREEVRERREYSLDELAEEL